MLRKIIAGQCVDVSECERYFDGRYILAEFREGVDYCDAHREIWIWSIGRRRADGVILASTANDLYQHPDFECLFLR